MKINFLPNTHLYVQSHSTTFLSLRLDTGLNKCQECHCPNSFAKGERNEALRREENVSLPISVFFAPSLSHLILSCLSKKKKVKKKKKNTKIKILPTIGKNNRIAYFCKLCCNLPLF